MAVMLAAALSQAIVPRAVLEPPDTDPCALFETAEAKAMPVPRRLTAEDLVEIADIGRALPDPAPSPFGISPDGGLVAFLVQRANPEVNAYCQRLLVVPSDGTGPPHEIARGGDYIRADFRLRNFPSVMAGWAKTITPRWSPDGSRIAFLRRANGTTQVWLADPRGAGQPARATELPVDVDDFAWSADGKALVVATRPGIRRQARAIAREARAGFLFDARFSPQLAGRPIPVEPLETRYSIVDLASGSARPATDDEAALIGPVPRSSGPPPGARGYAEGPDGAAAWLEPVHPERLIGPMRTVVRAADGTRRACEGDSCEGIQQLWWAADGTLFALRRTGWAQSRTALLRWDLQRKAPRQVLISDDVFIGCAPWRDELICTREGSVRPRRLVAIDMTSGRERVVYDPNPAFGSIRLGPVERLRFRNAFGAESYADLVLPPNHAPGQRHPLVVVQYISHGFLRGGTGDEVPIQLLAARGFAVLSFARPDFVPEALGARTEAELRLANRKDWIDRRRVQSSLERAIALAIASGSVDPARMGISGFSDGSSTVQWALIHSDLFKVVAIGSCCEDMYSFALAAGPAFADFVREMGYRYFEPGTEAFWTPMSLVQHVDEIDEPILIQAADSEYEGGLDVFEAFRHRGKAIELHVFEDETHYKWQPAHRLAIYQRYFEWFEFWLMHRTNCAPDKAEQYRRWTAMRDAPAARELHCSR
jgi:dipeptidyl aminopeptidase/acylaminoacyl peptidase